TSPIMTLQTKIALGCKRLFDIVVAGSALCGLSPLIGLIAAAIKLDDGGPVLFVQDRVGKDSRPFRCYKFRTMVLGAESIGNGLIVTENDGRITRVGRLLRQWTLDEIPQLINVLMGDMSIVGPRPWVPDQAAYCSQADSRRFNFKPGMAGWAWIHGRNRLAWEERVRLDLFYVDHWSLALDFSILTKAFVLLFRRDGVYFEQRAGSVEHQAASKEHGAGSQRLGTSTEHGAWSGEPDVRRKSEISGPEVSGSAIVDLRPDVDG
ncbi:MAG TPA: sugar transferase, partial [Candidatus Binatia bacterium]